jgi:predicted transcriptional regulator
MSRNIPLIGKNIKKFRKKLGISQDKLSKLADVSITRLSKLNQEKLKI